MNLEEVRKKVLNRKGIWAVPYPFFFILSKLFCFFTRFRYELYKGGILKTVTPGVPVISVGNIVAGGTGKTPLVEYIYAMLQDAGFTPAVVMRGYGGKEKGPVVAEDKPERFGDEAALYVRRGFFVVVSRDRLAGIELAVSKGANIVIFDDGFQQLGIKPTVNIVVVDPFNPFGGNMCLPLGTLREPVIALERADCFVISRANLAPFEKINSLEIYLKTFRKQVFKGEQCFKYWIDRTFKKVNPPEKEITVFCGIGSPQQFLKQLKEEGFEVVKSFLFPDHHFYTEEDIETLSKYPNLVTTEKDLVKIKNYDIDVKVPVLGVEVFGLKEFILNRIKNVEKHEEKDEKESFVPDGVSVSQPVERGIFKES